MTKLPGKIVLITGAAGGFGQSLTKQLLAQGSKLILADLDAQLLKDKTALTVKNAVLEGLKSNIIGYLAADLSTTEGAKDLHEQCRSLGQDVDILINNAGIAQSGPFVSIPQDKWEKLIQINLLAPMRLTSLFGAEMVSRGSGHIVNISSAAGLVGTPGLAPYSTAKFGLRGFTEATSFELKKHGVAVTGVYPFFAKTAIIESPHYGPGPRRELPASAVSDPDVVMRAVVGGIKRNRVHVYPTLISRAIDVTRRIAPWTLPLLGRAFDAE